MIKRFYLKDQKFDGTNASELRYIDAEVKPDNCVESVFELLPAEHPKYIGKAPEVKKVVKKETKPKKSARKVSAKTKNME